MRRPDPTTPAEWQEAADAAVFCLGVDSARQYGFVETDMEVDSERCEDILRRAPSHGAVVRPLEEVLRRNLGVEEPGEAEGVDAWPTEEDMATHCGGEDPGNLYGGGCGDTLRQHHYGHPMAPCHVPGCRCTHFR